MKRSRWSCSSSSTCLIAPGSSFNTPYRDHFRITTLPDEARLAEVFQRIEHVLEQIADRPPRLETA